MKLELLAPAKNFEAARAAVDHGADAIYMGGASFGARAAATNSLEDVARSVEYAHQYGVRLYATLNTLLFDNELEQAKNCALQLKEAGVDAIIVQDMAYLRMDLGMEIHASTQMSNMTPDDVVFLRECGVHRVVLERNLTLKQIAQIGRLAGDVELEAFVHGAICVGYSGRCMLSKSLSSRSGNRGECSQPCRLPYDLVTGTGRKIMEQKHLLSVRDLNLSARLGELIDAGVSSFKIEGRLKEPSYTKNVVAHYRRALDEAMSIREGFSRSSVGESSFEFDPNPRKSFSRGETTYLFDGQRRNLASLDTPKSMGEGLGKVSEVQGNKFRIESRKGESIATLSTGDGLCYTNQGSLTGSNINRVDGGWITLNKVSTPQIGTMIYRNYDRLFEASLENSRSRRAIAVTATVRSSATKFEVSYRDVDGNEATAAIEGEFEVANNSDKMRGVIATQIAKCGETIFSLSELSMEEWGGEFIAVSQLSQIRRDALTALRERRLAAAAERPRDIFTEKKSVPYFSRELSGDAGVTNALSEQFYRDHGVRVIAPQLELKRDLSDEIVMRSSYCIRREIGECLRESTKLKGALYIEHGAHRYRLNFECKQCRMTISVVQKNRYDDREHNPRV